MPRSGPAGRPPTRSTCELWLGLSGAGALLGACCIRLPLQPRGWLLHTLPCHPPRRYVKNTSNTNVVAFGGRLWTLFEAGQPYRLDPATLETQCLETLDGQVRPGLPFDLGSASANESFSALARSTLNRLGAAEHMPPELMAAGGDAVTAHPHVDSSTGRLIFFSYQCVATDSLLVSLLLPLRCCAENEAG